MGEVTKIVVANRGEIAIRVIRAAKEMGIGTVSVYSDGDAGSPHRFAADESIRIGPAAARESYLRIDAIVEAARRSGADAVHPGYGFLAENPAFAQRVLDEGLIFIGPAPDTIAAMGDKLRAREVSRETGVPLIPGSDGAVSLEDAPIVADTIGYPVLIKAVHGGGGKGMHRVDSKADLAAAVETSIRESASAFGSESVYIEKYLPRPRHVEVQILADSHGNCVHLYERDCSIQRRHQKIVEESPSPVLTPQLRETMCSAAVSLARAVGYCSAGTVEFLVSDGRFYFLEMNTRIQVEHPVTEEITGIDLVQWQIRIARGEPLSFTQEEIPMRGHAVECRIYAEDPEAGFLPAPGPILRFRGPTGPGIRFDGGIETGFSVRPEYDPILGKLITSGRTREEALDRMALALSETVVLGTKTSIAYLRDLVRHPDFRSGDYDTHFTAEAMSGWHEELPEEILLLAAGLATGARSSPGGNAASAVRDASTPWETLGPLRIGEST